MTFVFKKPAKPCVTCKFVFTVDADYGCAHDDQAKWDVVTGERVMPTCRDLRSDTSSWCKLVGEKWEAK